MLKASHVYSKQKTIQTDAGGIECSEADFNDNEIRNN